MFNIFKMGNEKFEEYLIQNITSVSEKIDNVHKEVNGLRKLQEKECRENAVNHTEINAKLKALEDKNVTKDNHCLKINTNFMDEIVKQEVRLKEEIENVRNRNFFAYGWEWLKKDIRYIILVGTIFNLDAVINGVKYIIDLMK